MKQLYLYKVVKNNLEFPQLFEEIHFPQTGETVSVNSLFENNKKFLLKICKNEKKNALIKSQKMIKFAKDHKMIERVDENYIPAWFTDLKSIQYWQSQLRGNRQKNAKTAEDSTKKAYLRQLWNFNKWLTSPDIENNERRFKISLLHRTNKNTFVQKTEYKKFQNVEEILDILEGPFIEQKTIIRIIKQYLLDEKHINFKANSLTLIKSAIISYFERNEQEINFQYDPTITHNNEIEEQSMSLSDLMKFLTVGKPSMMEKALFLCKFQRGLDRTTLVDRFNFEAWEQLVKYFGSENHNSWDLDKCPVPITLVRIKVDYKDIGFLDRDAVYELQRYLDFRKKQTKQNIQMGDPIFLNKFGNPVTDSWVSHSFHKIAQRAGILKIIGKTANGKNIYNMDSHEIRDVLVSVLTDCGCREDVIEESVGHKPKNSYKKQAKLFPENLRKEYSKASKRLNIFTKFTSIVNGTDDSDVLKAELNDALATLKQKESEEKSQKSALARHEIILKQQQEEFADIKKELTEIKQKPQNVSASTPIEFCCADCSIIHTKEQCPNCGSKIRRIYE